MSLKKAVLSLTLAASIFNLTSTRADAAAGLLISNRTTSIAGGIVTGVGGVLSGGGYLLTTAATAGNAFEFFLATILGTTGVYTGAFVAVAGLIILDENTGALEFKELSADDKIKLKLTDPQFEAFNSELPEINALVNQAAAAADGLEKPEEIQAKVAETIKAEINKISQPAQEALAVVAATYGLAAQKAAAK